MIAEVLILSLPQPGAPVPPPPSPVPNTLAPAERTAGWRLLFDGRTFAGWRGLGYDTVPTSHWAIVDGAIKKIANGDVPRVADGRPLNGGDLMTVDTFGDFELTWEWKGTPSANSGVKRSEEHTSELQSQSNLVCRLLLEKKKNFSIVIQTSAYQSGYSSSL